MTSEQISNEMDEIIQILLKDCKPFLKEFNMFHNPIYRGSNKDMAGETHFMKVTSRRKRIPKDTPKWLHNLMDEMFFKHHGWKARSEGIFVTHSRSIAGNYGWQVLFFPKGKYQYLWNPDVEDLYNGIKERVMYHGKGTGGIYTRDFQEDMMTDKMYEKLENLISEYQKYGYDKVEPRERHEAMFKVHQYYMVSFDTQKEDRQFLLKLQESL